MKIVPHNDQVIVLIDKKQEKVGGIHLPEMAKKRSREEHGVGRGTVVAVGPGKMLDHWDGDGERMRGRMQAQGGMRVMFPLWERSITFRDGDDEYVVLDDSDVLAHFEDADSELTTVA